MNTTLNLFSIKHNSGSPFLSFSAINSFYINKARSKSGIAAFLYTSGSFNSIQVHESHFSKYLAPSLHIETGIFSGIFYSPVIVLKDSLYEKMKRMNEFENGGAIVISNIHVDFRVFGCSFVECMTSFKGGAIFSRTCSVSMKKVCFLSCYAGVEGQATYLQSSNLTVDSIHLFYCSGGAKLGQAMSFVSLNGSVHMEQSNFTHNRNAFRTPGFYIDTDYFIYMQYFNMQRLESEDGATFFISGLHNSCRMRRGNFISLPVRPEFRLFFIYLSSNTTEPSIEICNFVNITATFVAIAFSKPLNPGCALHFSKCKFDGSIGIWRPGTHINCEFAMKSVPTIQIEDNFENILHPQAKPLYLHISLVMAFLYFI